MMRFSTEDLASADKNLKFLQKRMWRIFMGACLMCIIVIFLMLIVSAEEGERHALVVPLASLLLWSLVVTAYAFNSLRVFAEQIRTELARNQFVDPITEVCNFRYLDQRLGEESALVRRNGGSAAVLYMDLDGFKKVNDRYGHHVGNVVLREIAAAIDGQMRACDVLGRVGGDEFAVLLPSTDRQGARAAAQGIVRTVEDLRVDLGSRGAVDFVTASVGVALFPDDGDSMAGVVSAADGAVYTVKERGGNGVCVIGEDDAGP